MTRAARVVLEDCRVALQFLEEETDLRRWRVHWAGAVALTRAVGHVLDKVDGADSVIKLAANNAFRSWKGPSAQHKIFREFIDSERNSILKEYRFNHHPLDEVPIVLETTLQNPATGELVKNHQVFPIGDNIYRPMTDGAYEGDDARDLLKDALDWWEVELRKIDEAVDVAKGRPPQRRRKR
jgi:hypothetical protein